MASAEGRIKQQFVHFARLQLDLDYNLGRYQTFYYFSELVKRSLGSNVALYLLASMPLPPRNICISNGLDDRNRLAERAVILCHDQNRHHDSQSALCEEIRD